jgi:uncharacterized repeat protein (TIGR01451 family)
MRLPLLALGSLLMGCEPAVDDSVVFSLSGPELSHTQPEGTLIEGDAVEITVEASDDEGVVGVRLYHRAAGSDTWDWLDMADGGASWAAGLDVVDPGLEYYFKASDGGDPQAVSYLPTAAGSEPFVLEVLVQALPLPFSESFELEDGEDRLRDLGWVSYEAEFPGYPWELIDGGADGAISVRHAVGNGDSSDLMDDWLIAPALDFSTLEDIQVAWYEQGADTAQANHGLYLSTGSRDPSDGDYVLVQQLTAPGEDWARSVVIDLSEHAGERVVWLAWRYEGADADSWILDAVTVEELSPDLSAAVASDPSPVHPGDQVNLEVTVSNATTVDATDVVVGLYVDMGDAGVVEDSLELGDVPGGGASVGQIWFTLDASLTDNSILPYEITLTAGDYSWTQDHELQLGYPSTAWIELSPDDTALVQVSIGVGDPDVPELEWDVLTATQPAGSSIIEVDITEHYELLPPAPGALRWFARVESASSGSVDAFSISFGDVLYEATVLPVLTADVPVVVYLPEPPDPVIELATTSSSPVQPGDLDVTFSSLRLYNQGDASSGLMTVSLSSDDPAVTIIDGDPVSLGLDVWVAGETTTLVDAFLFDISADKLDSQPVAMLLTVEDEVESFAIPLEVEVPWPVLRIVRVQVEDDDNGDGILDPGETATLEIEVANTGDQDSDGIARGSLTVLGTSTASATVLSDEQSFGMIDAGDSRSEDFDVEVTAGSVGDMLDLQVDIYDGTATFSPSFQFVLGEPPWLAAAAVDDARGDVLDGYAFDWINAWYRVDGGMFQLRCEATDTVDAGTVFIEGWGSSSGAGFVLYQLVINGGTADLLGWPDYGSHSSITTPTMSADGNELLVEWDPAVMDLSIEGFSMGFGAGWCGPPEYYCDSFPDGWGYPYDSYSSGDWLDLEW